jgi:hypothetical protein
MEKRVFIVRERCMGKVDQSSRLATPPALIAPSSS